MGKKDPSCDSGDRRLQDTVYSDSRGGFRLARRRSREFQWVQLSFCTYNACTDSRNKAMFGKEKSVQQSEGLETPQSSEVPSGLFEKVIFAKRMSSQPGEREPSGGEAAGVFAAQTSALHVLGLTVLL